MNVDMEVAVKLRGEGLSVREIATKLGLPKSTVHKALLGVHQVPLRGVVREVSITADLGVS